MKPGGLRTWGSIGRSAQVTNFFGPQAYTLEVRVGDLFFFKKKAKESQ